MDMREIVAKIESGFADITKTVDEKITAATSALRAELKLPATANAAALAEKAAAEGKLAGTPGLEISGPAYEKIDVYGGKGLMFARAARLLAHADRTRENPIALAKQWNMPEAFLHRVFDIGGKVEKALGESTMAGGGVLVPDVFSMEFIELLRARVALISKGITRIPMTTKTLTIGRQATAATSGWVGESQNMTKSQQTFDDVQLSLKKLACLTPISNDLLRDNVIAADIIVRNDLLAIAAREMDLKAMRGLGTQYAPKGIANLLASTQKFNSNAAGSPTLATAIADLNTAVRLVKEGNVPFTKQNAFWIMTPRSEDGYRRLRDGVGRPYFAAEMDGGKLMGYDFDTTTAIPNNLSGQGSGGSVESELYFVIAPEFYMGEGLTPTIEVARNAAYYDGSTVQSGLSRDETAISIILRVDFQLRHAVSGALVQGVVEGSV